MVRSLRLRVTQPIWNFFENCVRVENSKKIKLLFCRQNHGPESINYRKNRILLIQKTPKYWFWVKKMLNNFFQFFLEFSTIFEKNSNFNFRPKMYQNQVPQTFAQKEKKNEIFFCMDAFWRLPLGCLPKKLFF